MIIRKKSKNILFFSSLLVGFFVVFSFGFLIGKNSVICEFCPPQDINFSLFWEALSVLKDNFYKPENIENQKIIYGAISGAVKSLGDPYTIFLSPEEKKLFSEDVEGKFGGVGMMVGIRKGQLQVIAPLENTPAKRAGLRAGDKILKIGEKFTTDLTLDEAVSLIRGTVGTDVTLTILREGWEEPKEFKITRAIIEVPVLSWELKEKDIAYIKINQFTSTLPSIFKKEVPKILKSPAKKIILDLRDNPGGYLEVAQQIAGWFLKRGDTVTIEKIGKTDEETYYPALGNEKLLNYPVVVLINKGSASASEILAAALRDNRGIKIIGEKSYGKGSVQTMKDLTDGSSLKITIAEWLTPNKEQINEKGLTPDIEIKMTEEDYKNNRDPQLEKAIEIIKEIK